MDFNKILQTMYTRVILVENYTEQINFEGNLYVYSKVNNILLTVRKV
jgi:hypothetical protein